jgi:hypothetical protein
MILTIGLFGDFFPVHYDGNHTLAKYEHAAGWVALMKKKVLVFQHPVRYYSHSISVQLSISVSEVFVLFGQFHHLINVVLGP